MSSSNCTQFRPHHLRPDKCRNCFGDKSLHQQQADIQRQSVISERKPSDANGGTVVVVATQSREELIADLKRCHDDKAKLEESNEQNCSVLKEKNLLIDGYKNEIDLLKSRLDEVEKRNSSPTATGNTVDNVDKLRSRLEEAEAQRDRACDELRALEREMEEMHDNFKEEESEQFEQLKQELDLATKNCKILQIRLNKAERQYGQLEQVKSMLERQLDEWNSRQRQPTAIGGQQQATSGFGIQLGEDFVKLASREYDQLLRDLNDTIEREKDLQEQIKYSQEEAQMKSDRLQAVEAENEVLLSKVNKLTLANSRLRSNPMRCASVERNDSINTNESATLSANNSTSVTSDACDLIQQNEQLKLALDLAQSEVERLRLKSQEAVALIGTREASIKELEARLFQLGDAGGDRSLEAGTGTDIAKLELECRQLRTKLVHSERECKQLKAELRPSDVPRLAALGHSLSVEGGSAAAAPEHAKLREIIRQLREECSSLKAQNKQLEVRLDQLNANQNVGGTKMESDLLDKLKSQLNASENELAKAKSRLVELDLEYGRLQSQHKRLVESMERENGGGATIRRRIKLPPEAERDSMNRQELRQLLKDLVTEADELAARLAATSGETSCPATGGEPSSEEQVKTLRRLLDQERLLSNNLKLDVGQLEQAKLELQTSVQMFERERVAMDEELDKLRQLNSELDMNIEELKRDCRALTQRLKDSQAANEKLRDQLRKSESLSGAASPEERPTDNTANNTAVAGSTDTLLLMRDLSELKVKNGFLMRQLDLAREDTSRQLEDMRQAHELQQKRAVELAQLELKERHLAESQQLRDELNELKRRLAQAQRQAARNEEETVSERDRMRALERDWRRDKSQWQQRLEQLEGQLSIERRSNEFKSKEWESLVRDKERELISVQDRAVQLERDLKRMHNKYSLLEESSESKLKSVMGDLETKKRELSNLMATNQKREDEYYDNCKRFNSERSTLMETLESLRRSYDEKLVELKSSRELLALRQEQSYKERAAYQAELTELTDQLTRMCEHESQAKLLRQQVQANERQLDSLKRDFGQVKEERSRLKARCEELERRCHRYEKQELIAKTSHISATSFIKNPFHASSSSASDQAAKKGGRSGRKSGSAGDGEESAGEPDPGGAQKLSTDESCKEAALMVEKLTSKINDQRHLINLLKQQNEELQLEVKQLRLVQSSDKIRWQGRVAQLQSRLNACEEKLLFESQLMNKDTFETARRKLEVQWADERQMSLDTIQQQQAQNELLTRDLKKLGQAHELLRLQSKQLESHNNKLSRRLIEYQQQQQQLIVHPAPNNRQRELDACLAKQEQLAQLNTKLVTLMKDEAKPLIETVTKMVAALDVSVSTASPSIQDTTKQDPPSASSSQQSSAELGKQAPEHPLAALSQSTHRPLITPSSSPVATYRGSNSDLITAPQPQPSPAPNNKTLSQKSSGQPQSRFARLLGKQPKPGDASDSSAGVATKAPTKTSAGGTTKAPAKRVRVKSSSLGISLAEKKQLKRHLEQLNAAIDGLGAEQLKLMIAAPAGDRLPGPQSEQSHMMPPSADRSRRANSSPVDRAGQTTVGPPIHFGRPGERPHSFSQQRDSDTGSGSATPSRVHWQLDPADMSSDLDSNKSWSGAGKGHASAAPLNLYRRFPQSSPASYGASLTDYESESSLASYDDLSTTYRLSTGRPRFTSGAESDSCVGQQQQMQSTGVKLKSSGSKKRTLRTRLTSTLRNISRSITGLASDSESESVDNYRWQSKDAGGRKLPPAKANRRQQQALDNNDDIDNNSNDADHEGTIVREIRV